MIPLDLALAPPDAFQTALSDIRRVYCEDDFLLDNKAVDTLATKYDELRVTVKEVESNLGKYQEEAGCQYNGYKTLAGVSLNLTVLATEEAQSIVSRVAKLSSVKLFLARWSERFSRMTDILNIALGLYLTPLLPS